MQNFAGRIVIGKALLNMKGGEITPTMKVKRRFIDKHCADLIESTHLED